MNEFKVGDIVVLRSGSPEMTVTYIDSPSVSCTWYCYTEYRMKNIELNKDTLTKV